jgi:hypothetical protein
MHGRRLLLFFISLVLITGFFLLPRNRQWAGTVFSYWNDFKRQKNRLDIETRMRDRFRSHYIISKNIADSLRQRTQADALVLMPPNSYFKKMGVDYYVPVPPEFYYFTGVKTIWANSRDAITAGYYVRVSNGKVIVETVTNRKALQDTINAFQKLGVSL